MSQHALVDPGEPRRHRSAREALARFRPVAALADGAPGVPADRLQRLLDVLPAAVLVVDGQGRVTECNPAAEALLGQPLKGELWRDIILRAFDPTPAGEELALRDGRYVSLSTCPLGHEPGQILLLTDVTENRRLREHLERQRRLADMGRMAANLAHQIRTPLSSALLYVSQVDRFGLPDERRARFTAKALDSLRGLEQLVNDMLLFARGDQGGSERLRPADLLRGAVAASGRELEASATEWTVEDEAGALAVVGNRSMLESAIGNLIVNAVQAMGEGGRLELRTRAAPPGAVDLLVIDEGPGVSAEHCERIFEPFFTTRSRGTGLGLAVVRTIARAHRGEAWMTSEPGQGSTFALRLPAQPAGNGADGTDPAAR